MERMRLTTGMRIRTNLGGGGSASEIRRRTRLGLGVAGGAAGTPLCVEGLLGK